MIIVIKQTAGLDAFLGIARKRAGTSVDVSQPPAARPSQPFRDTSAP